MSSEEKELPAKISDSSRDRQDWQADSEDSDIPIFMRDGSQGDQGNAQDEKDKSAE